MLSPALSHLSSIICLQGRYGNPNFTKQINFTMHILLNTRQKLMAGFGNIELPYESATLFFVIYSREMKIYTTQNLVYKCL